MYLLRQVFLNLFLPVLALISCPANAALNYEQDVKWSSYGSDELSKAMANAFCKAAKGDPNIKVVNVEHKQRKINEDFIEYTALITCLVSTPDEDLERISGKSIGIYNASLRSND